MLDDQAMISRLRDNDVRLNDQNPDLCPAWIDSLDSDISTHQVAGILEGGCESGSFVEPTNAHIAVRVMATHGDDVIEYILDTEGELPTVPEAKAESWSGMATHYLTRAVDLWAIHVAEHLEHEWDEELEEAEA